MRKQKNRKRRSRKRNILPGFFAILGVFLGTLIMLGYLLEIGFPNVVPSRAKSTSAVHIRDNIKNTLQNHGIAANWIEEKKHVMHVRLPVDLHPLVVYQKLSNLVAKNGWEVASGKVARNGRMSLAFTHNKQAETIWLIPDTTLRRANAEIAIIIDDFGYHHDQLVKAFMALPFSVTYSIIPGLAHSKEIASELGIKGKAVMIHIPMEPKQGPVESGKYTLMTELPVNEIRNRIQNAVEAIPFAKGMNNHMGSKATTDSVLLGAAFSKLRKNNYYYVDSRTSSESIAYDVAKRIGIPALRNDIFLDPVNEQKTIEQKIHALAAIAKRSGKAIGIGHPRPNTLAALRKVVPELQILGYKFVKVDLFVKPDLMTKN
ncbi:MAG: divergent polysaccharide deacetylase family protein [bacterium]